MIWHCRKCCVNVIESHSNCAGGEQTLSTNDPPGRRTQTPRGSPTGIAAHLVLTHLGLFWVSVDPNQPLSLPSAAMPAWPCSDLAGRESLLPPENSAFFCFFPSAADESIVAAACVGRPAVRALWTADTAGSGSLSSSLSSFFPLSKDQRRLSPGEVAESLRLVRFCRERDSGEHFSSRTSLDWRAAELLGVDGSES